ncbi:MAG: ATP-binding protein [Acetatifactor sp.]|nr:ATP-binding protein [Acetatifactor sp.]
MRKFVGRSTELQFLNEYFQREGSQILVVYGGKGVGKTALLQEFCRDKKHTYFLARACSEREQRFQWAAELCNLGKELGRYPEYAELFENATVRKETAKQIVVIDEFHHVVKGDSSFFEELIRYVEGRLLSRPVMVVLVTSASGWVENTMVSKIGRSAVAINGWMKVREMALTELAQLFPGYSKEDCIGNYAVLGGIPGYWMCFSQELNTGENIIRNVLRQESRLYEEMSVFLLEELREPAVYNTILAAMARDCNKLNDIYKHTGFSRAKISVYLKNLMELDLVEKVFSYETAGRVETQKGIYRISNSYVKFYFRYLFSGMSDLRQLTPEEFYEQRIAPSFSLYADEAYRKVCREQIGRFCHKAGEWLGKSGTIDVVAADAEGKLTVASCSYAKQMTYEDYEWLLFCMKKARVKSSDIRMYCEKGFDEALQEAAAQGKVKLFTVSLDEGR